MWIGDRDISTATGTASALGQQAYWFGVWISQVYTPFHEGLFLEGNPVETVL